MYYYDQGTICKSSYLMATTFGCAAVGLILGLIQILPEQRRDQWAALLHRPVPRSTIYRGKAMAGFLLYLFATVPPFVATVWYASSPGHFSSPVVPQMLWAGVADTCAGAMYYFAALFVGLRRGAWYGTRAFGFLAAIWVSFFVASSYYPLPRVPIEASILMALTLFVAGWGSIMTNGRLSDQPWVTRFAVITVIFYGVCCLGIFISMVVNMFSRTEYYYGTQYNVTIEGRPLKFTSSRTTETTITDLADNVIHDKRFVSGSSYNYLLGFAQISTHIGDLHKINEGEKYEFTFGYRNNQSFLTPSQGDYDADTERWYYLPIQKEFVGYFHKTNQRIGSIGQDGFRPGYEPVAPLADFNGRDYGQIAPINQIGQTVYKNDFDQRKLTPIFSEPGATLYGAAPMQSNQDQNLDWAAVALLDRMVIIDKTGKTIATLPYHQDMDRWGSLSVAIMPSKDKFFLRYRPSQWISYLEQAKMPEYLEEMDTNGNILTVYTLPPIKQPEGKRTWQQFILGSLGSPFLYLWDLTYTKIGAECGSERLAGRANYMFGWGWPDTKEMIARTCVASLIFAGVAFLWARRVNLPYKRAGLWTAFVLAFNLAGLITFRLVADWPVRVKCPQCGRKRPVEETLCPHCQALWPKPQENGMEIFEEKAAVEQTV
jgi:hypothetical protein